MKPVVHISQSLTPTEQIRKRLRLPGHMTNYLVGLQFYIETDHEPQVRLLSTKNLDELPVCIQRFRIGMMRFLTYFPGK